jgi:hypothetical protein
MIWKKGGCHGDGMSESIPDDVFNISRRSKCQKWARINDRREGSSTWFLIQKGRMNHLRLPRSIDNKRITPGIYYTSTCSFLLDFFLLRMKIGTYFGDNPARKFRKKMLLFSKEMWIDHARTDVHANHLPNDMFGQLSSPHNRKEKKKRKSWTLEYSRRLNVRELLTHSKIIFRNAAGW